MYMISELREMAQKIEDEKIHNLNKSKNEVEYKMALKMLKIFLHRGVIDPIEYAQIDALNRERFSPHLSKVYV